MCIDLMQKPLKIHCITMMQELNVPQIVTFHVNIGIDPCKLEPSWKRSSLSFVLRYHVS